MTAFSRDSQRRGRALAPPCLLATFFGLSLTLVACTRYRVASDDGGDGSDGADSGRTGLGGVGTAGSGGLTGFGGAAGSHADGAAPEADGSSNQLDAPIADTLSSGDLGGVAPDVRPDTPVDADTAPCTVGMSLCGGGCTNLNTDPTNCGSCGHLCLDPPAGGAGVCLGAAGCSVRCDSGKPACGGTCCPDAPANALATCAQPNQCSVQCNTTFHACNGASAPCFSDNDATHCGPGCLDCRQPNATAVCGGNQCANTCLGSTLACPAVAGKPNCGTWDFESGTSEGWMLDLATSGSFAASDGAITSSAARAVSGAHSLALGFSGDGQTKNDVRIVVPLCAGGQSIDMSNKSFHMYVALTRSSGTPLAAGFTSGSVQYGPPAQQGFIDYAFDNDSGQFLSIAGSFNAGYSSSYIEMYFDISVPWTGTIYIDDIEIK
jgi:hypothetical protein